MDFSKTDKLTERNKENSFLDVDWIITELINYGHEKLALVAETSMSDVPNSPQRSGSSCSSHALQRSTSLKNVTKVKKKVNIHLVYVRFMSNRSVLLLASNIEIGVEHWLFIYFLLFCLGKFIKNQITDL